MVEQANQQLGRCLHRAPVGRDEGPGCLALSLGGKRIGDPRLEKRRQVLRRSDPGQEAPLLTRGRDVAEILYVRADDDRNSLRPGLDGIVPADWPKASADKRERSLAIEGGQFAD